MFTRLNDCSTQSSHDLSRPPIGEALPTPPFDQVYIAPDAALHADELAAPPGVVQEPDGSLWLVIATEAGEELGRERVLRIDHIPPFALLYVREDGLSADLPAYVGYLVHESALPTFHPDSEEAS